MNNSEELAEEMPLVAHLRELRNRLAVVVAVWLLAFMGCYLFIETIYAFLVEPLADAFANTQQQRRMIFTGLTETFFTYMKLAAYAALFIAFPVIAGQIYLFMAPGLYKKEKKLLLPFLLLAPVLFFSGALLAYYGVMPLAWQFFLGFETPAAGNGLPIELEAKVSEYLSLVIQLVFAFGLAFQLPIGLSLAVRVGLLQTSQLRKGRKYAVVMMIIAAALLTPPDIISQILLFIPLYMLYEISIIISGFMSQSKPQENDHA